ncbi:MAG: tetratricopeptide repeat protein [Candidatus Caldatribacteriota bacterium]|nr:tetratricopeptide repeat protein [Candidatus Caldatribacteriota bacterium]
MRKIFLLLLLIIFGISIIEACTIFADSRELSILEFQQYKILKLSKVTQDNPQDTFLIKNIENYKKGLEYYKQQNYTNAISELLKVNYSTLVLPLYIKSQYILGDCYKKVYELDKAIEIYKNLIPKDLLLPDFSLLFLAQTYQLNEDYQLSNDTLKIIIQDFPDSSIISKTYYQIAQNFLELNELDSAEKYFKKALEKTKDNQLKAEALFQLSEIFWQENKPLESINCIYEILHKGYRLKRNSEPEERLIRRYYSIEKYDEEIIIPYPVTVKVADILFKYRQYIQAEKFYNEIIKNFPEASDIEEIYYKRARTLYYKKEYREAINCCKEIINKFSLNEIVIRAEYLLSNTYLTLGEIPVALNKYHEIIEQHSQSYYARQSYLRIAECYFRLKENEKAISMWQELNMKHPNSSEAMISLWKTARYYDNEGNYTFALNAYRKLLERFSKSSKGDDANYWMAKTLQKLGLKEKADTAYKNLISNYPLSYYTEKVLENRKEFHTLWPVFNSEEKKVREIKKFLNKFSTINDRSKLLLLKAELFKEISFFKEAIIELREALDNDPGSISILFYLSDIYKENEDYYNSLYFTEIIFSYLVERKEWDEIPFELWKNLYPDYYNYLIDDYAQKYDIDPLIVLATIREESRFNPWDESVAGARGLMQIIYSTGEWIAQKINLENFTDEMLFSPKMNIDLGCWYINYLKERFSGDLILIISGYNAGPGITSQWLKKYNISDSDNFIENIPYDETREHVKKVLKSYLMYKRIVQFSENIEK